MSFFVQCRLGSRNSFAAGTSASRKHSIIDEGIETLCQRRWMLLTLDTLVDFFAMNGDIFRCADADAHLVGLHVNDGHGDIVADHKSLANASCQFQHGMSLSQN
jgi:hypothetical protein